MCANWLVLSLLLVIAEFGCLAATVMPEAEPVRTAIAIALPLPIVVTFVAAVRAKWDA